jgi:translation elongation factor EF-Tu-like GTPase
MVSPEAGFCIVFKRSIINPCLPGGFERQESIYERELLPMSSDPAFRMTVADVFFIRGRGTIVTGQIESGTLNVNDEVYIQRLGTSRRVTVTGIEMFRKTLDQARAGDNVGVLLRDITKQEVEIGDVLLGSDLEFSWKP